MAEFLERYRLWVGSILFVLVLVLSSFLVWREGKWKPDFEKRLAQAENRLETDQSDMVALAAESTDPATILDQSQAGSIPSATEKSTSTKTSTKSTPKTTSSTTTSKSANSTASSQPVTIPMININTAGLSELDLLPGVGPAYAQRIVDYRTSHGGFKTIDEIKNVKGIGDATFAKMKQYLKISD